jgi:hypothetical protein
MLPKIKSKKYEFLHINDLIEIEKTVKKYTDEYRNDFTIEFENDIKKIEKFIDLN